MACLFIRPMATHLPNPSLIPETVKTADMISISSQVICGEVDFRYRREKVALTSGGNEVNFSG